MLRSGRPRITYRFYARRRERFAERSTKNEPRKRRKDQRKRQLRSPSSGVSFARDSSRVPQLNDRPSVQALLVGIALQGILPEKASGGSLRPLFSNHVCQRGDRVGLDGSGGRERTRTMRIFLSASSNCLGSGRRGNGS